MPNEAATNTVDVVREIPENQEGTDITQDALSLDMSDYDFVVSVNDRIRRAKQYWEELQIEKRQKINFKYWVGEQVNKADLRDDLEKSSEGTIFRNIESFIPIATARPGELICTPTYKNEDTRKYAKDMQRSMITEFEDLQGVRQLVGRAIRNHQINLVGVLKYGYDPKEDKFWTQEIVATDLVISKYGDFVGHYIKDKTIGDLLEMFPDKKKSIMASIGLPETHMPDKKILDSPTEYLEIWTPEMVGYKIGNDCLGKKKNPHFDYEGREVEVPTGKVTPQIDPLTGAETMVPEIIKQTVKFNHFKSPKPPFLFLVYFNRGVHVLDDTSLIEQAIGPQDWINKRKRQIGANADSTNGHWVSSGDFISQEEFDKIEGGIDEKIWLENGLPADGLQKITGQPLPDYIYNDLLDSRQVIDNLMGTHATTRGESAGNNTLGQDLLQKDQDYGRVDGYIRDGIEPLLKNWYEAMYHMYLVYQVDEKAIPIPEEDDFETENVVFSRDRVPLITLKDGSVIPVPLLFRVKQGSTMPQDEVSTFARAKEMKDILTPMDYFKMTAMPNPRELAKNLELYKLDPLYQFKDDPDVQELLMQKQQEAMAMAAAAGQTQAGAPAGEVPPAQQTLPPDTVPSAGGDETTPEGVANAMRAVLEEQGVDPAQMMEGA